MTRRFLSILLLAAGCQSTVGSYFAHRGRDLSECVMLEIQGGVGMRIEARAAGLLHLSLGAGAYFPPVSLGAVYGSPRPVSMGEWFETDSGVPFTFWGGTTLHRTHRGPYHSCYFILPGLWSWTDPYRRRCWIWSATPPPPGWVLELPSHPSEIEIACAGAQMRGARIHAFDIDASVFLGVVGVRAGISPGEILDFLLGWFGFDIAGDDDLGVLEHRRR